VKWRIGFNVDFDTRNVLALPARQMVYIESLVRLKQYKHWISFIWPVLLGI
jgi:hypothetical protein